MRTEYLAGNQKPRIASHPKDLDWKESPDGYEYAAYKLGTIRRLENSYLVALGLNQAKAAKSLVDAIKIIDQYTKSKLTKKSPKEPKN